MTETEWIGISFFFLCLLIIQAVISLAWKRRYYSVRYFMRAYHEAEVENDRV